MGHCARDTKCNLNFDRRVRTHKLRKTFEKAEKAERAMEQMSREVAKSVMGEMESQEKNMETIGQRFLENARERYIAWGCDKKCTDFNTEKFGRLHHMSMCSCPAVVTIKGDTSIFF